MKRASNPNQANLAAGHMLRALAAIKATWDRNQETDDWDELLADFAHPARIEVLIFVAVSIADRAGMSALDLEAWGDEFIAKSRMNKRK